MRAFIIFLSLVLFLNLSFSYWVCGQASDPLKDPLVSGDIYKLSLTRSDVYKISGQWLRENLNLDLSTLDPSRIQLFGIRGGKISEMEDGSYPFIREIPLKLIGTEDGTMDEQDYLLFYFENQDQWYWNEDLLKFEFEKNPFANNNNVFLKIGLSNGKRIAAENTINKPDRVEQEYLFREVYHVDKFNLLGKDLSTQGSGQEWAGEEISNNKSFNLKNAFTDKSFEGLKEIQLELQLLGRSDLTETVELQLSDNKIQQSFSPVDIGDVESIYARKIRFTASYNDFSENDPVSIIYNKRSNVARLWIDYAFIQGKKNLNWKEGVLRFNNVIARRNNNNGINLGTRSNLIVWDITDPYQTTEKIPFQSGQLIEVPLSEYAEYLVFNPQQISLNPLFVKKIKGGDILNFETIDMLLVYAEELEQAAKRLGSHRSSHTELSVKSVTLEPIADRFASGRVEPGAIRNYARYLYQRYPEFRYLLLFGDASYDYRGIDSELAKENLVPTYETVESFDPLLAFPSDDYYALLDPDEGTSLSGDLDIAVGRIPVRNLTEAQAVVNKIMDYDINSDNFGDWKLKIAFLADDEDNNIHLNDTERIVEDISGNEPDFNLEKIYLDAFVQQSTPGGNRYPDVSERFNQLMSDGMLIANYFGHGGPRGWSQERVLKHSDISSWSNFNKLPLIITATCSFTGFDDPSQTTAGEAVLLNPAGGAVALLTTVRSVYASKNFRLTQSVFRHLFEKENGNYLGIGEVMRRAKNEHPTDNTNARKFFTIGDPSMRLAIPTYRIQLTEINGKDINEFRDTLGARSFVSIRGKIVGRDGKEISGFNGSLETVFYDKVSKLKTLANDPGSFQREFEVRKNILFRGRSRIKNGEFQAAFYVPLDINYNYGNPKFSFYASSDLGADASGYFSDLIFGGSDIQSVQDDQGPDIEMIAGKNDSGEIITGPDPLINIILRDESGINISNASLGHEISAVLDDRTKNTYILNELFVANTDDYKGGSIALRLSDLSPGKHILRVKAYDVFNNPGEGILNFVVSEELGEVFERIEAFPNPTDGHAEIRIVHKLSDGSYKLNLELYDERGAKLGNQEILSYSRNGIIEGIKLNPEQFGGLLDSASGIYFYKIVLYSPTKSEKFHSGLKKIVILK